MKPFIKCDWGFLVLYFKINYCRKYFYKDVNRYISILELSTEKGECTCISYSLCHYSRPYLISMVDTRTVKAIKNKYHRLILKGHISGQNDFNMVVNSAIKLLGLD